MPEAEEKKAVALWKRKLQPVLHGILISNDSPRQIAAGVALGAFLAFTPTVGIQTVLALCLATYFHVSRIPAAAMVYITNPLTIGPIYWSCYLVGAWVCRSMELDVVSVKGFVEAFEGVRDLSGFQAAREGLSVLTSYGLRMAFPLCVGCFIEGVVAAAICYPLTLRFVEGHRVVHARKVARKLQKKAHDLAEAGDDEEEVPEDQDVQAEAEDTAKETGHEPGDSVPN